MNCFTEHAISTDKPEDHYTKKGSSAQRKVFSKFISRNDFHLKDGKVFDDVEAEVIILIGLFSLQNPNFYCI